ncbi:hypothetical protein MMC11_005497 [Xylographa trunciseda]|nr:hypothetical protein [Xylographa trunciseda]
MRFPLITNELFNKTRNLDESFADIFDSTRGRSLGAPPAAFICLQEVLHVQLVEFLSSLNNIDAVGKDADRPDGLLWAHIGVPREDGHRKGEYSPIIYPLSIFELLYFENIWLSPTSHKPNKGWDAGSERILIMGVFEYRSTSQRMIACCTHLDNAGSKSRKESIAIHLDAIERAHVRFAQLRGQPESTRRWHNLHGFRTREAQRGTR